MPENHGWETTGVFPIGFFRPLQKSMIDSQQGLNRQNRIVIDGGYEKGKSSVD
jgi:hypothetical protein